MFWYFPGKSTDRPGRSLGRRPGIRPPPLRVGAGRCPLPPSKTAVPGGTGDAAPDPLPSRRRSRRASAEHVPPAHVLIAAGIRPPPLRDGAERCPLPPSKTAVPGGTAVLLGGSGWIRTTEVVDNRFTVCPLWPLGNAPLFTSLLKEVGAGRRTRTPDLLITNQLLYQLSYTSTISSESYLNRIPFICQPLFYVLGGNFLRYIRRHHPDPQRVPPAETCHRCGAELYPGSPCWRFWGRTLCDECVAPWLLQELAAHRGRAGEVEP